MNGELSDGLATFHLKILGKRAKFRRRLYGLIQVYTSPARAAIKSVKCRGRPQRDMWLDALIDDMIDQTMLKCEQDQQDSRFTRWRL